MISIITSKYAKRDLSEKLKTLKDLNDRIAMQIENKRNQKALAENAKIEKEKYIGELAQNKQKFQHEKELKGMEIGIKEKELELQRSKKLEEENIINNIENA